MTTKSIELHQDKCEEPLLAWGVRESDEKSRVHIGLLTAAENGAACKCLCLGCGGKLAAINVDKPASHFLKPRTQRPHFKHRNSTTDPNQCLSAIARLLALKLFVEQKSIYLPPRRRIGSRDSIFGLPLTTHRETPGETVEVTDRTWIDDHRAVLHLADGREVLVTVRAKHTVDQESRSTCILSLAEVCDPAIANWDTETILQHLRRSSGGMKWDRHWDDQRLDEESSAELDELERQYLGGIPEELIAQLTSKQLNETLLHWLIKKTIAGSPTLHVPAYSEEYQERMPDGSYAKEIARCEAAYLQIDDARFERRLGSIVPDVICRARDIRGEWPECDLLIEAAVTNYMDEEKKQKVKALAIPCIQIRADRFEQTGKVRATVIEQIILSSGVIKEWIVHPLMEKKVREAKRRLADRRNAIKMRIAQEREMARHREEARERLNTWLSEASDDTLVREYLKVLGAAWANLPLRQIGQELMSIEYLRNELLRRKVIGKQYQAIESTGSILQIAHHLKNGFDKVWIDLAVNKLVSAVDHSWKGASDVFLLICLLKQHKQQLSPEQSAKCHECIAKVRESIKAGRSNFVRDTQHDRLYALLVPEMSSDLSSNYGTQAYIDSVRTKSEERTAHELRVKQRREHRQKLVKAHREKKVRQRLELEIDSARKVFAGRIFWIEHIGAPKSPAQLYGLYNGRAQMRETSSMEVFKVAFEYLCRGLEAEQVLKAISFKCADDVSRAVDLLKEAKIFRSADTV